VVVDRVIEARLDLAGRHGCGCSSDFDQHPSDSPGRPCAHGRCRQCGTHRFLPTPTSRSRGGRHC
jgi:hypothetical protein